MKPRSITTLQEFDAVTAPTEGGRYIALPLPATAPTGHHLENYFYTRHPVNHPGQACLLNTPGSGLVASEIRKYHDKVEVEWRRVVLTKPRKTREEPQ